MKKTDPQHPHHNCIALFERLSEYIDRELDVSDCEAIEAHIQACPPCMVCLKTLEQTVKLCKHLNSQQVPESLSLKLRTAINDLIGRTER